MKKMTIIICFILVAVIFHGCADDKISDTEAAAFLDDLLAQKNMGYDYYYEEKKASAHRGTSTSYPVLIDIDRMVATSFTLKKHLSRMSGKEEISILGVTTVKIEKEDIKHYNTKRLEYYAEFLRDYLLDHRAYKGNSDSEVAKDFMA